MISKCFSGGQYSAINNHFQTAISTLEVLSQIITVMVSEGYGRLL